MPVGSTLPSGRGAKSNKVDNKNVFMMNAQMTALATTHLFLKSRVSFRAIALAEGNPSSVVGVGMRT
jgi:hypothetical protein